MDKAALGLMQHDHDIHIMQFGVFTALFLLVIQALAVLLLLVSADTAVDDGAFPSIDLSACLLFNTRHAVGSVVSVQKNTSLLHPNMLRVCDKPNGQEKIRSNQLYITDVYV